VGQLHDLGLAQKLNDLESIGFKMIEIDCLLPLNPQLILFQLISERLIDLRDYLVKQVLHLCELVDFLHLD
jgi:hypothetical protein